MAFKKKPRDRKAISDVPLYTPEYMCNRFNFKVQHLTKLCGQGVLTETEDYVWIVLNNNVTRLYKKSAITKLSARKTGTKTQPAPYMTSVELRAQKEKYNLKNADIARGCGFVRPAVTRWLNNKVQISRANTTILREYFAKLEKNLTDAGQ